MCEENLGTQVDVLLLMGVGLIWGQVSMRAFWKGPLLKLNQIF